MKSKIKNTKNRKQAGQARALALGSCSGLPFNTAPKDGTRILAWDGDEWVMAFYEGGWYGDHHSSTFGTSLDGRDLTHWLPQPPRPNIADQRSPE